jgi:MFS family permease
VTTRWQDALGRLARLDALVLASLLWFMAKFLRYTFPPLFGTLSATFGVSTTALGVAFSGFMVVYALMQFPSGLLADRLGSVVVIAGGSLLAAVAALALALDAPFVVLVGAMVVMGAGTGTVKTVAVRLLSGVYPSRTGRALGILDTFGAFGGAAAPAAVVAVASLPVLFGAGWRTLFLGSGVVGIGLVAAFVLRVSPPRPATAATGAGDGGLDTRAYAALFRDRRFGVFLLVTLLVAFGYNGTVAFLPLYLTREAGLASATAGAIYSALFVASLVQLLTGEASDRVGTLPVLVVTLLLGAVALAALVLLTGGSALALGAAVVALGLGAHGYRPVRGAYLMAVVPDSLAGGGLGVVRTLLMGAGAVAPAVVGYLSETAGFRPAFWLLAATMAAAALLTGGLWLDDRGVGRGLGGPTGEGRRPGP